MEKLFFIMFAILAITSAIGVVSLRNPIHSALSLMVCLFQVACLFVLLRSPFLAVVQVFIYVGAVMVLFLFVVLILDVKSVVLARRTIKRSYLVYILVPVVAVELLILLVGGGLSKLMLDVPGEEVLVSTIGRVLFTEYLLPFELVSILLLVAMVAAIVMAKEGR